MRDALISPGSASSIGLDTRVPALDGLRGMAILLVLIYHNTFKLTEVAVDKFVAFWVGWGWSGVDLFFVLSGFLITGILYDTKRKKGYFRNFYARRILRIFPLYYAVLTVLFIILPSIPFIQAKFGKLTGGEIWYWLYLSNFSLGLSQPSTPRRFDVFWSLAIEEQFYLIWPLIVSFMSRRLLMFLCIGIIGLSLAWRSGLLLLGAHPLTVYVLTPSHIDSIAIGAFIALAARGENGVAKLRRWASPIGVVSIAVIIGIAAQYGRFEPFLASVQIFGYTFLALFFGALLVLAISSSPRTLIVRVFEHPLLRVFGRYSYALYLFHVPVIVVIHETFYDEDQFFSIMGSKLPGQLLFYAMTISATFFLAWLSWNLYEKHFLEMKNFFRYERHDESLSLHSSESVAQKLPSPIGQIENVRDR